VSQTPTLADAASRLLAAQRIDGRGTIFAVCAGRSGVGTSYVARELALAMAGKGASVMLADMDIGQCTQTAHLCFGQNKSVYGPVQGPYDATYGVQPFWQVTPTAAGSESQSRFGALYQLPQRKLTVTGFLWDAVKDGQTVQITHSAEYWEALRNHYHAIFIDVPAPDRSEAGATVFGYADSTVLVTPSTKDFDNQTALQHILGAGGTCAGVIVNTVPANLAQAKVHAERAPA